MAGIGALERTAAEFVRDLQYGLRLLTKDVRYAVVATGSLAVGIGSCVAVFAVFNGLSLRELPYPDAGELVHLSEEIPTRNNQHLGLSYADLRAWGQSTAFTSVGGFRKEGADLNISDRPVRINVVSSTYDLLRTFGVQPWIGRGFLREEDSGGSAITSPSGHRVVLLSYGLWARYLGGDKSVLGSQITIGGVAYTIIGVLPPTAVYPADADCWIPLGSEGTSAAGAYVLEGVARLAPSANLDQARADVDRIHNTLSGARPQNKLTRPVLVSLRVYYVREYQKIAQILLMAVCFVLLISCLNVAGLLLARGKARDAEFRIRLALGAAPARLVRQILVEIGLLSIVGVVLGSLVAFALIRAMLFIMPGAMLPSWVEFGIDLHFLWLAGAMTAVVVFTVGIAPVLALTNRREFGDFRAGTRVSASRGIHRGLSVIVVSEIAIACVLSIVGGLVLEALDRVLAVDLGFRSAQVVTFAVDPSFRQGADNEQLRLRFAHSVLEQLHSRPGIEAVGLTGLLPLTRQTSGGFALEADDEPAEASRTPMGLNVGVNVTAGYFRAMGIALREGREFSEKESEAEGVVIVSSTLARRYWPRAQRVVGKRIRIAGKAGWLSVVGVVEDVRLDGPESSAVPQIYWPYVRDFGAPQYFVVRSHMAVSTITEVVRQAVRQIDPNVAIFDVKTMDEVVNEKLWTRRGYTAVFSAFAIIGLILAGVGVYGLVMFTVEQRMREIGIKMAVGAAPKHVALEFVRKAASWALGGIGIGLPLAWLTSGLLRSLLVSIGPHQLKPYLVAVVVIAGVTVLASLIPARRGARVDPAQVLKLQ